MAEVGSFSELDCYRQCQFKHQLAYRERWVDPAPSPALQKGTLWHSTLEVHYNHLKAAQDDGRDVDPELIMVELTQLLNLGGDQTEVQELIEWMYCGYVEQYGFEQDSGWKILSLIHI